MVRFLRPTHPKCMPSLVTIKPQNVTIMVHKPHEPNGTWRALERRERKGALLLRLTPARIVSQNHYKVC